MRRTRPSARDAADLLDTLNSLVSLFGRQIHGSMHFWVALIALPKTQRLSLFGPDGGRLVLSIGPAEMTGGSVAHSRANPFFFVQFTGIGLFLARSPMTFDETSATTNKMCAKISR